MDVQLLVYDLSRGLARQMSMGILGFQLDAIYHTSILLNGREYVYDGGIIAITPGTSHLGQPMEKIGLGTTHLPMDVIEQYLESLKPIFTLEAYDLFHHNCNNFSDTFSNFLVGKGIPEHISTMPQAVLQSPMGRTLFSQLTQSVNAGRQQNGSILGLQQSAQAPAPVPATPKHSVHVVTSSTEFYRLLDEAKQSSAVVFFTMATCGPCRAIYPLYDQLAQELGHRVTFLKVDITQQQVASIAREYDVRATPTFVTFLRGQKENEWKGGDPSQLQGNLRLLANMGLHRHERLRLPTLANPNTRPVLYTKVPPLEKLIAKMDSAFLGKHKQDVETLRKYLEERAKSGPESAVIPNMTSLASLVQDAVVSMPAATLFTMVDLFRCSLSDPRISGYFAEEAGHKTVADVVRFVVEGNGSGATFALRLVTLQMACNCFSSPLFAPELFKDTNLRSLFVQLVSSSFLEEQDSHSNVRASAASLLFNLALEDRMARTRDTNPAPLLSEEEQVELAASVVEAIGREESAASALKGMLWALGNLVYCTPLDGELADLLRALDAQGTVLSKKKAFPDEGLITEVGSELLGKGLVRD